MLLVVGCGSSGWQAPEQLRHGRQTRAVDLFSLGCLLFFCLTGGQHPFGESIERDVNIVNNRKDFFLVENFPEAMDLISHLLDPDPDLRYATISYLTSYPTQTSLCSHMNAQNFNCPAYLVHTINLFLRLCLDHEFVEIMKQIS